MGDGGDHHHHRRPYDRGFGGGYVYPYAVWPDYPIVLDPWLFGPDWYDSDASDANGYGGYPESTGYPDSQSYAESPDAGYPAQGYAAEPDQGQQTMPQDAAPPPYYPQQGYRQPYAPQNFAQPSRGSAAPSSENAVTLIFKDGRPPEQIHNYLLTATTLTVLDQHDREIPLDQIDVAATQAANRATGVDFRVPAS